MPDIEEFPVIDEVPVEPAKDLAPPISSALQSLYETSGAGFEPGPIEAEARKKGGFAFGESQLPAITPFKGESLPAQALAAAGNVGYDVARSIATPAGEALGLALPFAPPVIQGAAGVGFGVPMVKGGLEQVYRGAATADPQQAMEGTLETLVGGGTAAGGISQIAKAKGVPNAIKARVEPKSNIVEYPRAEEVGVRPQTGGGDSPEPVTPKEEVRSVPEQQPAIKTKDGLVVTDVSAQSHADLMDRYNVTQPDIAAKGHIDDGKFVEDVTPTVTETTPPVPKEELPTSPTATGLRPAIRLVGGRVVVGDAGVTHPDIIKANDIKAEHIDQRGFVNEKGEFQDREQAATQTQLPTKKEAERLHSTDLPEATPPPKGLATSPPAELQMAVVPGAKEFIEQDLAPALKQSAKVIGETANQVKSLLSPPSMGSEAEMAAGIAREAKAELAQKDLQAREKFDAARKSMDSLSKPASLAFIDSIERGSKLHTPEAQTLADSLRSEFDKRVSEVRSLGTGKLREVYENYFPHIWKDPESAVSWYSRILGKRPLRGPASFLKQRSIDFTSDGVAAGLEPVSWNPIELSLLKMHEMDRYVMGQKIFNEFKEKGLVEFSRSDIPPEGKAKIDDRIGNVVEYRPTVKADGSPGAPERIIRGHYYAQEDAARVLNNFLSPGLEPYAWYRALRWTGNTLNLAQLGLSGYHFLFTMLDSATAKLALGLEQVERGDFGKGVSNVAKGIAGIPGINQLEYFLKGSKVLKEYTKPGSVGGDYAKVVDALLAGGGRTEMPRIFKNSSLENFMSALRSGNYPGAVIRAPFAAIQAISHPLMQVIVPRLKLGSFADMARYEIEKMGPGVNRDEFRKTMGKIWDSVDNRMGEMVYDNLFWNRTLKDTSFLAVRAVGWNLGTIRELGGSLVDSGTLIKRLRAGDPAITRRMNYAIALPITVGMAGAMYQYLKTGKGPQELRDYFYPKTGKMLPDGTEERVNFPSYLKDVYAYKEHPLRTVAHKLHPMWSAMYQMLTNQDYYGTQIRNPDDPFVKQVGEELGFVAKQFVPFSVKGAERRVGAKESPEIKGESFMGIMPIPPEIARTAAQNKIMEYGIARLPKGARTQEEQDRFELKRDLESQIQSPQDYEKAREQLKILSRQGKLTRGQQLYEQNKLRFEQSQIAGGHTKSEAQWLWRFKHLSLPEARHVYEVATPQEQKLFDRDLKLKEKKAQPE